MINEQIRDREVRLIGENGEQLGIKMCIRDSLSTEYGIDTRSGGHCAPLMHGALGTVDQGAVRFSFSHFNTEEQVECAVRALKEY